ncbi:MAG TPA: hypothetical protein DCQ83_06555 [Fibrobacteres bacterium]|jgi:hypothetical protein|nr:hypothetical protein [Fibrobacterota bacterium]
MSYKIELRYLYGWDDAGWTEEKDGVKEAPLRFGSFDEAQIALNEFFDDVSAAVMAGNIDQEKNICDYRIAKVFDER